MDTVESMAITTTVIGLPAILTAKFGWVGAVGGIAIAGGLASLSGDRDYLVAPAILAGGVSAAAGGFGGWIGAGVATAAGLGYGYLCR